jgi:putative nucleotidyltransferase with HDIG domain
MRQANLILLVDRVDAMAAPHHARGKVLQHSHAIRKEILSRSGTYFSPELVSPFMAVSAHEAFWLSLEPSALNSYLQEMEAVGKPYLATHAELLQLAHIFAHIRDAKSSFTFTHSSGVARLARRLAEMLGVPEGNCDKLEIAGLLHDLGKLRVPDEILEKQGPLDADERLVMNSHSFETMQILRKIRGFDEITAWAANHHEAPGGSGYPQGLDGSQLPLEARILRVADIFQAMVQDRPYRKEPVRRMWWHSCRRCRPAAASMPASAHCCWIGWTSSTPWPGWKKPPWDPLRPQPDRTRPTRAVGQPCARASVTRSRSREPGFTSSSTTLK